MTYPSTASSGPVSQQRVEQMLDKQAKRRQQIETIKEMKAKGCSNVLIAERLGLTESSVRTLLSVCIEDLPNP